MKGRELLLECRFWKLVNFLILNILSPDTPVRSNPPGPFELSSSFASMKKPAETKTIQGAGSSDSWEKSKATVLRIFSKFQEARAGEDPATDLSDEGVRALTIAP